MTERIHIAGPDLRVGSKLRQLCAWCGHVLIDMDLDCIAVSPNADGSPGSGPGTWAVFALVAVDGNAALVVADDGGPLPLRCCASQRKLTLLATQDGGSK